ncbi:hypothetical protein TNIN_452521 [Trichonephila inaurata madagascariensis]|uniref:LysM domain-containing protein n=1 Tax=Trichonephila inaurata madagascariensis TaxID=2747483 RepID=A0A8X6XFM5_9ARAC|nr:hypothetical protein TNIN_452521 [Trichonephila inaurata madagascariensis]
MNLGRRTIFLTTIPFRQSFGVIFKMLFEECLEDISLKGYNEMHVRCKTMSEDENFNKKNYIKHFVQPGDTLQGLALQYGVNVS